MSLIAPSITDGVLKIKNGVISNVTSIDVAQMLSDNISEMIFSGFQVWDGGAPYYSITGGVNFNLLQSGYGYIKSEKITFASGQTVVIVANSINTIYIDSGGLMQVTNTPTGTLYENNIGLFEVLYDGTVSIIKKETHPYNFPWSTSEYIHDNFGSVVTGSGANLDTIGSSLQVQIVGDAQLMDHGLTSNITSTSPITINFFYLNGTGKWIRYSLSATFPLFTGAGGTPTALTGMQRGVFRIYAVLDDWNTSAVKYVGVMHNASFVNLSSAITAINDGTILGATNELKNLEMPQLGYVIVANGTSIVEQIIVQKTTASAQYSSGGVSGDHLLLSNINGGQYLVGGHTGITQRYVSASSNPTANSDIDNYLEGCIWLNQTTDAAYVCTDNTDSAAVWRSIGFQNSAVTFNSISTDTITEKTLDNGIDIETVHLENGNISNVGALGATTTTTRLILDNSLQRKITPITGVTTLDNTYNVVSASTSTTSYDITLPAASAYAGIEYSFVYASKTSTYTVTIIRAGADTIDGIYTNVILANEHDRIRLMSNGGSIWYSNI